LIKNNAMYSSRIGEITTMSKDQNPEKKMSIYERAIAREKLYNEWGKIEMEKTPNLGFLPIEEISRRYDAWLKENNIDVDGNPLSPPENNL
jgi:uncharacterized protein involved in tolerance to divalent cations